MPYIIPPTGRIHIVYISFLLILSYKNGFLNKVKGFFMHSVKKSLPLMIKGVVVYSGRNTWEDDSVNQPIFTTTNMRDFWSILQNKQTLFFHDDWIYLTQIIFLI